MSRTLTEIAVDGAALPVVRHARGAGPVVAITANVHGDETTGVGAVHALDRRLVDELVAGAVVLYPSVNPNGLAAATRAVPEDGGDLNRCFPGRRRGSASERLAHAVWTDLVEQKPDLVVDLHADSLVAIPYAILDRAVTRHGHQRRALDDAMLGAAHASGLTVLWEYPDEQYLRFGLDRSLTGALVNARAIPAVTIEAGPRRSLDPRAVGTAVDAVWRILAARGVVAEATGPDPSRVEGLYRRGPVRRLRHDGVFVPLLAPGDAFDRGTALAEVRAVDGSVREVVSATAKGIVVSWTEATWVQAGAVAGTIGLIEG